VPGGPAPQPGSHGTSLWQHGRQFTWAGAPRSGKNRLHLDLRPSDQSAAVKRASELGARPADIGQSGGESRVVLQDPEGNVFCILQSDEDLRRWKTTR
jgi:hypothetical protein